MWRPTRFNFGPVIVEYVLRQFHLKTSEGISPVDFADDLVIVACAKPTKLKEQNTKVNTSQQAYMTRHLVNLFEADIRKFRK